MSETIQTQAEPGFPSVALPLLNLPQELSYDGTFVSTITVEYDGVTYVQTFLNDGTNITNISRFVPQP